MPAGLLRPKPKQRKSRRTLPVPLEAEKSEFTARTVPLGTATRSHQEMIRIRPRTENTDSMANGKTHALAGAAVGAATCLAWQFARRSLDAEQRYDWTKVLCWAGVGLVVASAPDILEPAFHPNHRSLFHSAGFGVVVLWMVSGNHMKQCGHEERKFIEMLGFAYLSHLGLDCTTPQGLPWL